MSDSWDDYAEEWDSNEDAISYSEEAFKALSNAVQLDGLNILDFGCGTGLLTEKLSPLANQIVALDVSHIMILKLNDKKLPNVTTISKPISESVIRENAPLQIKFDLIVASSVFGFMPEYESILFLLRSLLVPGGILVQWDWLSQENDSNFGLSEERVDRALTKAGFILMSLTHPFSLTSSKGTMPVLMGVARNA
jgi:predicted TPR repeat methyltransferase